MTEANEKWTKAPLRLRKMRMVRRLVPDARRELLVILTRAVSLQ